MSAIEIDQLRVTRGSKVVLPSFTLGIDAGRITGLLGPSGCGKSTLMRSMVGVQKIESGSVSVLGHPAGSRLLRSRVGYVTQAPSVYDDLTVIDNLRYFARILHTDTNVISKTLQRIDLADVATQLVGSLSGGQLARVSLGTALLNEPDVLVLDEPTVGLDPLLRRDLWSLFRGLADTGATLVISSHVMDEADHCDDLVLMRDGRLLAKDTPDALRRATGAASIEDAFVSYINSDREAR